MSGRVSTPIAKTVAYYCAFVVLGFVPAAMGPALPVLAEHTRRSLASISILLSARSLGYLVGSFQGGRLYDRLPGHWVMASTLVLLAAMLALVPAIPQLWVLVAVVLTLGVAGGALDVGGNTLLLWVHRREVGPYMNALHFFFGVGAFLSPIIIAQSVRLNGSIQPAFLLMAMLMLPVAVWVLRLPSPEAWGTSQEDGAEAVNRTLVALFVLFFFLYGGFETSFGSWIFTYVVESDLTNKEIAAYLAGTFWGALTVGRLLAVPIATRLQPRQILTTDLAGGLFSLGVILLWPQSLLATWLGTLGLGLSLASIFPTLLTMAGRRMAITGQITGWFFVGVSIGSMSIPWLMGQFFEPVGPRAAMIVPLLDLLVMIGIYLILVRKWSSPSLEGSGPRQDCIA